MTPCSRWPGVMRVSREILNWRRFAGCRNGKLPGRRRIRSREQRRIFIVINEHPSRRSHHQLIGSGCGRDKYEIMRVGSENRASAREIETEIKVVLDDFFRV